MDISPAADEPADEDGPCEETPESEHGEDDPCVDPEERCLGVLMGAPPTSSTLSPKLALAGAGGHPIQCRASLVSVSHAIIPRCLGQSHSPRLG